MIACKATFELEPGPARLSKRQVPIRGATGDAIGDPGGIDDLVPFKGSPEVLLVGVPEAPAWPGPRRVTIGSVDRPVPAGLGARSSVGPMGLFDPRRAAFASDFDEAMRAWREREIVAGVDPHFFNAAPRAQWVESLSPGDVLTLWNLHPRFKCLEVLLPDVRPCVLVERAGGAVRAELQADTLLLDLESGIGTLTFRLDLLETWGALPAVVITCDDLREEPSRSTSSAPPASAVGPRSPTIAGELAPPTIEGFPDVTLDAPAAPSALAALPFELAAVGSRRPAGRPVSSGGLPFGRSGAALPRVARIVQDHRSEAFDPEVTSLLEEAPAYPLGVSVAEPAPRVGPELLALERCARLDAEISRSPAKAAEVLAQAGHAARDFQGSERHWSTALQSEARAGGRALLTAYDEAFVARLEALRGPITVEDYAALAVARERGRLEPEADARAIPPSAVMRIERLWIRRLSTDPKLFKAVALAIRHARA